MLGRCLVVAFQLWSFCDRFVLVAGESFPVILSAFNSCSSTVILPMATLQWFRWWSLNSHWSLVLSNSIQQSPTVCNWRLQSFSLIAHCLTDSADFAGTAWSDSSLWPAVITSNHYPAICKLQILQVEKIWKTNFGPVCRPSIVDHPLLVIHCSCSKTSSIGI